MSDEIKYSWQQSVLDAFLAPRDSLPVKINVAERLIAARLTDPQQQDPDELMALRDALRALRVLLGETVPNRRQPENRKQKHIA